MSTLFVLKNVPVVFFSRMQKHMDKIVSNSTPPPSLFVSKQRRISIFEGQNTVYVSFTPLEGDWGGGGGGGKVGECKKVCVWGGGELSRMCLKPCFPACVKKTRGHFLTQKE